MTDLKNFRGKKIMTREVGIMLVCLTVKKDEQTIGIFFAPKSIEETKTYFFYMKENGERFISKGDIKSARGVVYDPEWHWAIETWGRPVLKLSEKELDLAVSLLKQIEGNSRYFGFEEKDFQARAKYTGRKIEDLMASV